MLAPGAQADYDRRQARLGTRDWDLAPVAPAPRYPHLPALRPAPVPRRQRGEATLRLLRLVRGA